MQNGGFVAWDDFPVVRHCACIFCMGVKRMPTEEELEQRITAMIDSEGLETAIREAIENTRKGGD